MLSKLSSFAFLLICCYTFGFTEISAVRRHPFYLMPYPVLKEKSDSTLEFNDFVTNNGQRKSRQLDVPLDVITHYNQHQFVGKLSPHNLDGQTFTVGARYNVGEVAGQC